MFKSVTCSVNCTSTICLLFSACGSGTYGFLCQSECNCMDTCDKASGECDGACSPGFVGNPCQHGKYH